MGKALSDKTIHRKRMIIIPTLLLPFITVNALTANSIILTTRNYKQYRLEKERKRAIASRSYWHLCQTRKSSASKSCLLSSFPSNAEKDINLLEEELEDDDYLDRITNARKSPSLSELEDQEERRLDLQIDDTTSRHTNKGGLDLTSLQHSFRAPSKSFSSSNTFQRQEQLSSSEDQDTFERQEKIRAILAREDAKYREERKRKKMGVYADITNMQQLKMKEEEERRRIEQENEQKAKFAKDVGVTLRLLEMEDRMVVESNFNPSKVQNGQSSSWFDEMDNQLNNELEKDYLGRLDYENSDDQSMDDGPQLVDGVLVSKGERMGVSIGSAGKWTLEIFPGDFVVHKKYGIGRFEKTVLKQKTKLTEAELEAQTARRNEIIRNIMMDKANGGVSGAILEDIVSKFGTDEDLDPISNPRQTVLEVAYSDAVVHIPVEKAYRLSRYRAGDSVIKPRLSKVKGEAWAKAKRKVEENTLQIAQDVLALYATRETLQRNPYDPIHEVKMREFVTTFPFEPTPDQLKCFEDVENDMVWKARPMDRLICGDVGFGKTEVALRALFRCVSNGRQAALLSPTGVLASQHLKNILQRMGPDSPFNFSIALLRGGMGKNTKAGKALRDDISKGNVNIVVGTHALLSSDLNFQDLGLLIVDEEQRFGVKQKERLKLISNGVDVLTLSATPIPRTLQMSISGIRDTSTIKSPPPMRKPTITYVQEFHKDIVQLAIERELARSGQCFYVVPRIAQLEDAEKTIKDLFPGIRVIQAHGRMTRGMAEDNVAAFAEGMYDILLATTVIENGVDIPSVNTIVVQNAQAFGMSALYQLRGRVGRSSLQAYAYFLHKEEAITEQSALRLQAMADLCELGSGFDVANRDLEIRGAGSLLGTEQSGMAARVGFDLYMRMLKKSIRQLKGLDLPLVPRTNVLLPSGEGSLEIREGPSGVKSAFIIPSSYIEDKRERSRQEGIARLSESTNQLVQLTNEWKEKYGPLPPMLQEKMKTLHFHAVTRILGIDIVGIVQRVVDGEAECILRSPGLRPRHWTFISEALQQNVPKGLSVIFPNRFLCQYEDEEEDWDALDQEEIEALKEISSASKIRDMDEIRIDDYPRFVVSNFERVPKGSRVDFLLKMLLPLSRIVHKKQQVDKETAKLASELRDKEESMKKAQESKGRIIPWKHKSDKSMINSTSTVEREDRDDRSSHTEAVSLRIRQVHCAKITNPVDVATKVNATSQMSPNSSRSRWNGSPSSVGSECKNIRELVCRISRDKNPQAPTSAGNPAVNNNSKEMATMKSLLQSKQISANQSQHMYISSSSSSMVSSHVMLKASISNQEEEAPSFGGKSTLCNLSDAKNHQYSSMYISSSSSMSHATNAVKVHNDNDEDYNAENAQLEGRFSKTEPPEAIEHDSFKSKSQNECVLNAYQTNKMQIDNEPQGIKSNTPLSICDINEENDGTRTFVSTIDDNDRQVSISKLKLKLDNYDDEFHPIGPVSINTDNLLSTVHEIKIVDCDSADSDQAIEQGLIASISSISLGDFPETGLRNGIIQDQKTWTVHNKSDPERKCSTPAVNKRNHVLDRMQKCTVPLQFHHHVQTSTQQLQKDPHPIHNRYYHDSVNLVNGYPHFDRTASHSFATKFPPLHHSQNRWTNHPLPEIDYLRRPLPLPHPPLKHGHMLPQSMNQTEFIPLYNKYHTLGCTMRSDNTFLHSNYTGKTGKSILCPNAASSTNTGMICPKFLYPSNTCHCHYCTLHSHHSNGHDMDINGINLRPPSPNTFRHLPNDRAFISKYEPQETFPTPRRNEYIQEDRSIVNPNRRSVLYGMGNFPTGSSLNNYDDIVASDHRGNTIRSEPLMPRDYSMRLRSRPLHGIHDDRNPRHCYA